MTDDVTTAATPGPPPTVTTEGLDVRKLLSDPEALILYALLAAYLFIPEAWRVQAVDRIDDPLAMTLISIATGGRFLLRATSGYSKGTVAAAVAPQMAADAAAPLVDEPDLGKFA